MASTSFFRKRIQSIARLAKQKRAENKRFFKMLKEEKPAGTTRAFRQAHVNAFEKIDCRHCGNCCRTSQAVFTPEDVGRISKYLKLKRNEFIEKYLKADEDYDYLIRSLPCSFLDEQTNLCTIYEVRPIGCRTYPPAKLRLSDEQLDVLHDNVGLCPAVYDIVEEVKKRISNA